MAHLVWDWNGTLLNDLDVVVAATNASLAAFGAGPVTAEEHRRDFRRPVEAYYADVIGRVLTAEEFAVIDAVFHKAYVAASATCLLTGDALDCLKTWPGTQSLLSMWFHEELVPAVESRGLAGVFARIDGRPTEVDIASDPELTAEYGERIPVIMLDGKEHGYWRVEEDRLLRDIARPPGAPRL